jgi:hypothetical protein
MVTKCKFFIYPLTFIILVALLILSACGGEATPTPTPSSDEGPTPEPAIVASPSDVTGKPEVYDEKTVELLGQAYLAGSLPRLLVDSRSGINLSGNISDLEKAYYHLTGVYDADTNTLNVTESKKEQVEYLPIDEGKKLGINLVPISVQGLIATPPKEAGNILTGYISIAHFSQNIPIYSYVVYAKDGFYLVLSDSVLYLPAEFTLSAGEVKGTLVQTPLEEIDFGSGWQSDEFGGVIIANSIEALPPVQTTVEEVNASLDAYMFKRVSINAGYLLTTATIDYSEAKLALGQGVLASKFTGLFEQDANKRIETIDLKNKGWQLHQCQVTGTVICPTEEILAYLDYSAPLSKAEVTSRQKPALIVETITDEEARTVDINELNPLVGNSSQYWDKTVEFEGWSLGVDYPMKKIAQTIADEDIAMNVNLLAAGIADQSGVDVQFAIIGLDNELVDEHGEIIYSKYRFRAAVNEMTEKLFNLDADNTALFLLAKEELAVEVPIEYYDLTVTPVPPWGGKVTPESGPIGAGTKVTLTATPLGRFVFDSWGGDASGTSPSVVITMDSDKLIYANFKPVTYSLEVSVMPADTGSVTISPLSDTYEADSAVSLKAYPASGYVFDYWDGDASGTNFSISILMDSDKSVVAHFKRVK